MLFNVTTHSWKAVSLRLVGFFSHLWQPFVLYYSVFWYKLRNYFWLYAMNICINIDLEVFLVTSPFGQPLSCRWLHLLLVIELVLSSNPRSSIHCIRLRSTFPVCFFCPNGFFFPVFVPGSVSLLWLYFLPRPILLFLFDVIFLSYFRNFHLSL